MVETTPASANWSARDRVVGALVVTYLALQLALPTLMLFRPRTQRFGWQMFTSAPVLPRLVLHRAAGAPDTLDVNNYFAVRRPELQADHLDLLAAHICRVAGDATLVELWVGRDSTPRRHPCP